VSSEKLRKCGAENVKKFKSALITCEYRVKKLFKW